jgi:hypothetical protein
MVVGNGYFARLFSLTNVALTVLRVEAAIIPSHSLTTILAKGGVGGLKSLSSSSLRDFSGKVSGRFSFSIQGGNHV